MNTTQAVVLAGGKSSRFEPFTSHHKSAISLCGKPVIYWTLESLVEAGISQALVVLNPHQTSFVALLQAFKHPRLQVKLIFQPEPRGMADALLQARTELQESYIVCNASQVNAGTLVKLLVDHPAPVVLLSQATQTPQLYGVVFTENGVARRVIEKPAAHLLGVHEATRLVGVYRFSKKFTEFLAAQPLSEYSLESSLDAFVQTEPVPVLSVADAIVSLKYSWQLLDLKNTVLDKLTPTISPFAEIHPTAVLDADVSVAEGATIGAFAVVSEGSYIGKNAVVGQHCIVRKHTVLEENAEVQRHGEVAASILLQGATMHSGFVGDSVIGEDVKMGAGFVTANKRFDRAEVATVIHEKKVATGRVALGALVGEGAQLGVNAATMPGTIITAGVRVQPGSVVKGFIK